MLVGNFRHWCHNDITVWNTGRAGHSSQNCIIPRINSDDSKFDLHRSCLRKISQEHRDAHRAYYRDVCRSALNEVEQMCFSIGHQLMYLSVLREALLDYYFFRSIGVMTKGSWCRVIISARSATVKDISSDGLLLFPEVAHSRSFVYHWAFVGSRAHATSPLDIYYKNIPHLFFHGLCL